jgi:hypothetical protein
MRRKTKLYLSHCQWLSAEVRYVSSVLTDWLGDRLAKQFSASQHQKTYPVSLFHLRKCNNLQSDSQLSWDDCTTRCWTLTKFLLRQKTSLTLLPGTKLHAPPQSIPGTCPAFSCSVFRLFSQWLVASGVYSFCILVLYKKYSVDHKLFSGYNVFPWLMDPTFLYPYAKIHNW